MVSVSILSANFNNLIDEIKKCMCNEVKYLHLDIMDGHFVPNISFGPSVISNISKVLEINYDIHLMLSDPLKHVDSFIKFNPSFITIHYESNNFLNTLNYLKEKNIPVGVSIKPNTSVNSIIEYLDKIDLVLVMSVEPGFGGQKFLDNSLEKIKFLDNYRKKHNLNYLIEVDGGINNTTSKLCLDNGCDILVCGSFIFNSNNYLKSVRSLYK